MNAQLMLKRQRYLLNKLSTLTALALAVLATPAFAGHGDESNAIIAPPNARYQGLSYSE